MPVFKGNLLDPSQELSLHQGLLWDAHMTPDRHNFLFQTLRMEFLFRPWLSTVFYKQWGPEGIGSRTQELSLRTGWR